MLARFQPLRRSKAFTLIELLVAITISVMLLSILAQVFKLATAATRDANMRISTTERLRALNIRMRQEFGNMLNNPRPNAKPVDATYDFNEAGADYISFSTSTDEDGRPVNVDVKYVFKKGTSKPSDGKLIRRRDLTGPYLLDNYGQVVVDKKTNSPTINPNYAIGDEQFFEDAKSAEDSSESTVMMTNVRSVKFRILDKPLDPTDKTLQAMLNPRTLPAAVEMEIENRVASFNTA